MSNPINYLIIEGPDLSGKTTLYEKLHNATEYRWNIQDRSALSMLIHAKFYGRNTFCYVEQLKQELFNLNNQMIILLPEWEVIADRFGKRGDPIQNLISLKKLYELFSEAAAEFETLPNVTVVRREITDKEIGMIAESLLGFESLSYSQISNNIIQHVLSDENCERIGLNFVHYDAGEFLDVNARDLKFEKEKAYYEDIKNNLFKKIKAEQEGRNEYNKKQNLQSRRYIFSDERCISLAHFIVRDQCLDCKFFIRSSDVVNILRYDLNFLKSLAQDVYDYFNLKGYYCRIETTINSAHILQEKNDV